MRILIVCPLLPYPPSNGGKKAVFYPVKHLSARGHQIHFACLSESDDRDAVREMEKYCTVDLVVSSKRPTAIGVLSSLFSDVPYDIRRFQSAELLRRIRETLSRQSFDLVQIEGIHAACYGLEVMKERKIPVLLRSQNVHFMNLSRAVSRYSNPLVKAYLMYETRKVRRYELWVGEKFATNMTISANDAELLRAANPRMRCDVVGAGVDIDEFSPDDTGRLPLSVLWMGALDWRPNQDSFWWFYNEIVPLILQKTPNAEIVVVGSNPPGDILKIRHPNVRMLGHVPDVRAALRQARVSVVPLKVGSGIRIKLLEMFAMKNAVVSTAVGCEGLGVTDGKELLIADDAKGFADAVTTLLGDPGLCDRLGANALRHVRENFGWDKIAGDYEKVYNSVAFSLNKSEAG